MHKLRRLRSVCSDLARLGLAACGAVAVLTSSARGQGGPVVLDKLPIGHPTEMALSPDGATLFVFHSDGAPGVAVIDTAARRISADFAW